MRGRSCGSLLVMLLLVPSSPLQLRGQTSANSATDLRGHPFSARQPSAAPEPAPLLPGPGHFPHPAPYPIAPITFPQIVRASAMIFAGTVTKIEAGPARGGTAIATVAVTFRVEHPLRGAIPGESLTILQWLGLWAGGQRYQVGEHVLLFLYPQSKLGLTSAVAGPMGCFHFDPAGRILLSEQQLAAFRPDLFQEWPWPGEQSSIGFSDFARALRRASRERDGMTEVTQ
jgi:hypothetical protein